MIEMKEADVFVRYKSVNMDKYEDTTHDTWTETQTQLVLILGRVCIPRGPQPITGPFPVT